MMAANNPKRGHHVINDNVLTFFRGIIDEFLRKHNKTMDEMVRRGLKTSSQVYRDYTQPFDGRDTKFIDDAVVFPETPYIDTNASEYGQEVGKLRKLCLAYMDGILAVLNGRNPNAIPTQELHVKFHVQEINAKELFIDQKAYEIWPKTAQKIQVFEGLKERIKDMFR